MAKKNSNFNNFRKFRINPENRTYATLMRVFYSILTGNLKKKIGADFEKILKMSGRLHVKYPQILKIFQNLKASTRARWTGVSGFINLEKILRIVEALVVFIDGRFAFNCFFGVKDPQNRFWVDHVFYILATGFIHFAGIRARQ